jgi:hypothetical protein
LYHFPKNCVTSSQFYKGITNLWEAIICPKGELVEWHNKDYLYGQCFNYGIQKLFLCPNMGSNLVEWKRFALEKTKAKNGNVLKKLSLVYKKTISYDMLDHLKLKLRHFVKHNFVAQWEDK